MSSESEGRQLVIASVKSEAEFDPSEEELLGVPYCSELDDALSGGTSDLEDLLDNDLLLDEGGSVSQNRLQQALKPSQRNPVTAPKSKPLKPSKIVPITGPRTLSTSTSLPSAQVSHKNQVIETSPLKLSKVGGKIRRTAIALSGNKTTSLQRLSPVRVASVKVNSSQNSIKPQALSRQVSLSEKSDKVFQDFIFIKKEPSPLNSVSEGSFHDVPFSSFEERLGCSEPDACTCVGGSIDDSVTKPSPSSVKVETSQQSSYNNSNPFLNVSHANIEYRPHIIPEMSIAPWGPEPQTVIHACSPLSPSNSENHACNPFLSDSKGSVVTSMRQVTCSNSEQQEEQSEFKKKSTIIKLNKTKVFRYVPEELPEVGLPDLAMKKRTMRKRLNSYSRDDCPELLLETKRHVGEDDLRSMLTSNRKASINEVSSTGSETQKEARVITCHDSSSSSPKRVILEHKIADLRQTEPLLSSSLWPQREGTTFTQRIIHVDNLCTRGVEPHVKLPLQKSVSTDHQGLTSPSSAGKEITFNADVSAGMGLQSEQHGHTKAATDVFITSTVNAERVSLTNHPYSPVKDSCIVKPKAKQCSSIFARRPNLLGRSSSSLNGFSLRHLDSPNCRQFALDHL